MYTILDNNSNQTPNIGEAFLVLIKLMGTSNSYNVNTHRSKSSLDLLLKLAMLTHVKLVNSCLVKCVANSHRHTVRL